MTLPVGLPRPQTRPQADIRLSRRARVLDALREIGRAPADLEGCATLLQAFVTALEAEQGVLMLANPLSGQLEFVVDNQPLERPRSYAEHYADLDPSRVKWWLTDTTAAGLPPGTPAVFNLRELMTYEELTRTEFYVDFLRTSDIEHALIAAGEASTGSRAVVCLHRSRGNRQFSAEDVAVLETLAPFVSNHLERMVAATVLTALPDTAGKGFILCDVRGRILYCNDVARRACLPDPPQDATRSLVEEAASPAAVGTAAFVGHAMEDPGELADRCGLDIAVQPVTLGHGAEGTLIVLNTPETAGPERAHLLQRRFALTTREIDVLDAMMAGATNRQIAAQLFVEECTVKKHMQGIATKVGARTRTGIAHKVREALGSGKAKAPPPLWRSTPSHR